VGRDGANVMNRWKAREERSQSLEDFAWRGGPWAIDIQEMNRGKESGP
jgi:hypothetical protein